jgi:hypothetical protein
VILMKKNFKELELLFPKEFKIEEFRNTSSEELFSNESINFLDVLSKNLLNDKKSKLYPDVATFGFYCRKANIIKLKEKHVNTENIRLGRGIIFHIAPSNVPVNFAYSLLCGILSGNTNIVRVPSKHFEQIEIIINAIEKICEDSKYEIFSKRIVLLRYDRQNNATNYFSSICDVRVIWGGDQSIIEIRKNELPPRAFDITFADRYSLCAINADEYVKEERKDKITEAFYNDTYLFDQNACTAPHLIIWLGDKKNVKESKNIFWTKLHDLATLKYEVQPVISVDKLTALYSQSIQSENIKKQDSIDNLVWRIELENLSKNIDKYRSTSGYFSEFHAKSISELSKIVNRKYQTLSYYGISKEELTKFIIDEKPKGIDRIVPIGKTTDFSLTWDGFDLIKVLSRTIEVK